MSRTRLVISFTGAMPQMKGAHPYGWALRISLIARSRSTGTEPMLCYAASNLAAAALAFVSWSAFIGTNKESAMIALELV